jgi:hypothetical protein
MPEHLELEDILALNPQVDEQLLEQARELLRKIRQGGIKKHGYNLASPYTKRYGPVGRGESLDPRTVRVGRPPGR